MQKYENDASFVDELMAKKKVLGLFQPDPDALDRLDKVQVWCCIDMSATGAEEDSFERELEASTEPGQDAVKAFLDNGFEPVGQNHHAASFGGMTSQATAAALELARVDGPGPLAIENGDERSKKEKKEKKEKKDKKDKKHKKKGRKGKGAARPVQATVCPLCRACFSLAGCC